MLYAWRDKPRPFNSLLWAIQRHLFTDKNISSEHASRIRWEWMAPAYLAFVDSLVSGAGLPSHQVAGTPGRILYVSHQMLILSHAPTKVGFDYSADLARRGKEVLIFNVNALPGDRASGFHQATIYNLNPSWAGVQRVTHEGQAMLLCSAHPSGMGVGKVRMLVQSALDFKPEWVISHGEFNVLGDALSRWFPTICLPTGIGDPVTSAHGIADYFGTMSTPEMFHRGLIRHKAAIRLLANTTPLPQRTKTLTREQLDLPADRFVFVVVGNRLKDEINDSVEKAWADLLERCPDTLLLMVGLKDFDWQEPAMRRIAERQVRFIEYETDLRALFALCDAYLNPPRQGGGMSASIAMAESLPVLTLRGGDVAAVVGEALALATLDDMVNLAEQLVTDEQVRLRMQRQIEEALTQQTSFEKVMESVLVLASDARAIFSALSTSTSSSE